jgi:hypothetical protein
MTTPTASGAHTPQFTHDSSCCKFLGRSQDGKLDLYTCIGAKTYQAYIARYGNDGSEYTSAISSVLDAYGDEHAEVYAYCKEARLLSERDALKAEVVRMRAALEAIRSTLPHIDGNRMSIFSMLSVIDHALSTGADEHGQ